MTQSTWWAGAICGALLALAAPAFSQESTPSPETTRTARSAFDAGVVAAKSEDYALARTLFLRSRSLAEKPTTLLNLALVDAKLGLADEGLEALETLQRISHGADYERIRKRAEALHTELTALKESQPSQPPEPLAVPAVGPTAEVPAPPAEVPASPANRAVEAAVGPAAPATSAVEAPPHRSHLTGPRALIVTGAVFAAFAVGGVVWWEDRIAAGDKCATLRCNETGQIDTEKAAAMAFTLATGVGAAALITGGSIWLVQRKHAHETSGPIALDLSLWPLGIGARGRF
ncbi:MAG: hypothetical protein RL385_1672 [Pseudomonadota bacterium]|jgi:hypothetical protein